MKEKWGPGKIAAVVFGSIGAGMFLLTVFYLSVFHLTKEILVMKMEDARSKNNYRQEQDLDEGVAKDTEDAESRRENDAGKEPENQPRAEEKNTGGQYKDENPGNSEYYEFHDEIRNDLPYQVKFETYNEQMGGKENVTLHMTYPVVSGENVENLSGINNSIQKEFEEVKEYTESVADWITEEETYYFETESYVTYMDENILSIAYVEYGYLDDEYYESYVISVNIDMESGLALTNSQMLEINDEFSIDFRNRCEKQNGEIEALSMYSDQDITEMLTSDASLIIFYTPMGMEVGFNYYFGWVTVTYQDYQEYESLF
ncbi:hypothetical protein D3Z60_01890 [Lachnospiraceae bacterium]|jgi:hypothetical protein|nr:hypothetical protein [Lachnospiraceae bacterium]